VSFPISRAADDRKKTATVYKSEKRKAVEEEGYRILGNSGDQWSELLAWYMSTRSFKFPNPTYYSMTETEKTRRVMQCLFDALCT
jgi:hypothetical protein